MPKIIQKKKQPRLPKIEPAQPFAARNFSTIVETHIPIIYIPSDIADQMFCLIDECETEIGWLGIVEQSNLALTIKEIFVPKQECHAVTTRFDKEGLMEVYSEIMQRPDGADLINQLRFWGHSHVMLETFPSLQDDEQMEDFRKNRCDYFIRGIFNKLGSARFDVFQYEKGVKILDVPWTILSETSTQNKTRAKDLIKSRVKKIPLYTPSKSNWAKGFSAKASKGYGGPSQRDYDNWDRDERNWNDGH
jgi:hypothetical protein